MSERYLDFDTYQKKKKKLISNNPFPYEYRSMLVTWRSILVRTVPLSYKCT